MDFKELLKKYNILLKIKDAGLCSNNEEKPDDSLTIFHDIPGRTRTDNKWLIRRRRTLLTELPGV